VGEWAVSGDAYTVRYCYDGELEERLDRGLLSAWRPDSGAKRLTLDELMIQDRLGEGTQSEVLSGYLPGGAPVAVKLGLKRGAISREAAVLSALSGRVGFPLLLHHEHEGSATPGGCLVMEVLGPSLEDLRRGKSGRARLSGAPFLRVGRGVLRLLRRLHAAGFVHNDLKPANVLLGSGAELQPKPLHLIDFGSCTRADGQLAGNEPTASAPRCRSVPFADAAPSALAALVHPERMRRECTAESTRTRHETVSTCAAAISPYLPISPHISPHLPISPHVSPTTRSGGTAAAPTTYELKQSSLAVQLALGRTRIPLYSTIASVQLS